MRGGRGAVRVRAVRRWCSTRGPHGGDYTAAEVTAALRGVWEPSRAWRRAAAGTACASTRTQTQTTFAAPGSRPARGLVCGGARPDTAGDAHAPLGGAEATAGMHEGVVSGAGHGPHAVGVYGRSTPAAEGAADIEPLAASACRDLFQAFTTSLRSPHTAAAALDGMAARVRELPLPVLCAVAHTAANARGVHDSHARGRRTQLLSAVAAEVVAAHRREDLAVISEKAASMLAWAVAKGAGTAADGGGPPVPLPAPQRAVLHVLAENVSARVSTFRPMALATLAWAYATAGVDAEGLYAAMAHRVVAHAAAFNAVDVTNTAWGFAKSTCDAPEVYDALARAALQLLRPLPQAGRAAGKKQSILTQLKAFKPRHLSSLAWAYARAAHATPILLARIAERSVLVISDFQAHGLAVLLWAYATAEHAAPALFDAAAAHVVRAGMAEAFTSQGLANALWAYAKFEGAGEQGGFYAAVGDALCGMIARGGSTARQGHRRPPSPPVPVKHIVKVVWSLATLAAHHPQLLHAVGHHIPPRAHECTPQDVANLLWAHVVLAHPAPDLFMRLAPRILGDIDNYTGQALSNVVWAHAKLDYDAPDVFHAVARAAVRGSVLDDTLPQSLTLLLWAFAATRHAGADAQRLFACVGRMLPSRMAEFNTQDVTLAVWAFGRVAHRSADLDAALAGTAGAQFAAMTPQQRDATVLACSGTREEREARSQQWQEAVTRGTVERRWKGRDA